VCNPGWLIDFDQVDFVDDCFVNESRPCRLASEASIGRLTLSFRHLERNQ